MSSPIELSERDKTELVDRFIRYCQIDTHSDPFVEDKCPSTPIQFDLAKLLVKELEAIGLKPRLTEKCFVYVSVPENRPTKHVLGLLAHMDVSAAAPSANVKPMIHKAISGEDLHLPAGTVITKDVLEPYKGHDIITSDGSTLLGADDKSGVASIMQFLTILQRDPDAIPHGRIEVCFSPDEEIGAGIQYLDLKEFPAEIAFTIDGSEPGTYSYETFNAYGVKIRVEGVSIHPGSGYGKLVNSNIIISEIVSSLPRNELPETTKDREGFYYCSSLSASAESATCTIHLRDFDIDGMERRKKFLSDLVEKKQKEYPTAKISIEFKFEYPNMRKEVEKYPELIKIVEDSISAVGLKPIVETTRGGTDGSQISSMGIPTPNIFAGGLNFHSRMEFISIPVLYQVLQTIIALVPHFTKE